MVRYFKKISFLFFNFYLPLILPFILHAPLPRPFFFVFVWSYLVFQPSTSFFQMLNPFSSIGVIALAQNFVWSGLMKKHSIL